MLIRVGIDTEGPQEKHGKDCNIWERATKSTTFAANLKPLFEEKCVGHECRLHGFAGLLEACFLRLLPSIHHVLFSLLTGESSFDTFDQHVRLSESEWIDILFGVEVGKGVVDETVRRLVRTDSIDDVKKSCIGAEAPIVDGDGWSGLVGPLRDAASLDVVNQVCTIRHSGQREHENCVMDDTLGIGSLLFEYTDEAVAGFWGDQVREEESVSKYALSAEDKRAEPDAGFFEGHESHQVH